MTSPMEQLYQQVILDHARDPHGKDLAGIPAGTAQPGVLVAQSHQVNPTCGDEVTLRVEVAATAGGAAVLTAVHWDGQGCSISQASVSVLTDLVTGAELAEVDELAESFRALMHARGDGLDAAREDALQDATAFTGVAKYPARIKCALLGWAALRDAIIRSGAGSSLPTTAATGALADALGAPASSATTYPNAVQELS